MHWKDQVEAEEEAIRAEVSRLPDTDRQAFYGQFNQRLKDPDTYATLAWSLPVGLHHFYLGNWLRALMDIGIFLSGIAMILSGIFNGRAVSMVLGILLILGVTIAEFYSLFRSQIIVQDHNNRLMRKILETCTRG